MHVSGALRLPGILTKPSRSALVRLWNYDDPAGSEIRFRRFVRQISTSGATDLRAEALTQLARAQALQGKFRAAHHTLDQALPLLPEGTSRARIRYRLERGRVFNSGGDRRAARPLFLSAWRDARRSREDGLAVDAGHMLALVESGRRQVAWNARALAIAEYSRRPSARRWRASLQNNIGWSRFDRGDFPGALIAFRAALRYRRNQRVPKETRIAQWCVAKTLRLLGRTSEALRIQRRLLAEWRRAKGKDPYVFEELGECLGLLGRSGEARRWFRLAHLELCQDPWLVANEPVRLQRLLDLSR
jgi:tetratricopeptide (TPR) repeat protein